MDNTTLPQPSLLSNIIPNTTTTTNSSLSGDEPLASTEVITEEAGLDVAGEKPDYDIGRYVYFYGLSVLLPVGVLCNLLCFAVFLSSRTMRKTSTGHFLIALAVADTIFLIGEILR